MVFDASSCARAGWILGFFSTSSSRWLTIRSYACSTTFGSMRSLIFSASSLVESSTALFVVIAAVRVWRTWITRRSAAVSRGGRTDSRSG